MKGWNNLRLNQDDGLYHGWGRKIGEFTVPPSVIAREYGKQLTERMEEPYGWTWTWAEECSRRDAMKCCTYIPRIGQDGIVLIGFPESERPAPLPLPLPWLSATGEWAIA
jgi:hypothetical protein